MKAAEHRPRGRIFSSARHTACREGRTRHRQHTNTQRFWSSTPHYGDTVVLILPFFAAGASLARVTRRLVSLARSMPPARRAPRARQTPYDRPTAQGEQGAVRSDRLAGRPGGSSGCWEDWSPATDTGQRCSQTLLRAGSQEKESGWSGGKHEKWRTTDHGARGPWRAASAGSGAAATSVRRPKAAAARTGVAARTDAAAASRALAGRDQPTTVAAAA